MIRTSIVLGALFLIAVAIAVPALAQGGITEQDIADARERRNEVARELVETMAEYETAVGEEIQLREGVQSIAGELALKERELASLRNEAEEIVRAMYMEAGNSQLLGLFDSSAFTEVPMRASYMDLANASDVALLSRLESVERAFIDQQVLLDAALIRQEQIVVEITKLAAGIEQQLVDADAEYNSIVVEWQKQEEERRRREEEQRRREEEEQRRREAEAAAAAASATSTTTTSPPVSADSPTTTAAPVDTTTATTEAPVETTTATTTTTTVHSPPPPVTTSGKTCPVNGATSFSNSWGAPRSGGRSHKGVDMVAARGVPIVAIESGVVERTSNSSLGGLSVYFRGNSGDRYYYAHLDSLAVSGGESMSVGGLLGTNGSTGNAPDWLPHVHFQWAPGGGNWVNPYPLVAELCY